jgi:hypothetical protein
VVGGGGEVRRKGGVVRSVIVGESASGIHSFRHTWRLALRLRLRSTYPTTPSAHRARTTIYHILPLRFNTGKKENPCSPQNKSTRINVQFFYFRDALCKSRNLKFAHKRVRAPLNMSPVKL